jgi:streptomycin 6-kinase
LIALPSIIETYATQWALSDITPFRPANSMGGTEFIAWARSSLHGAVVLKWCPNNWRLGIEVAALEHFGGICAVKICASAPEHNLYLMQALSPELTLVDYFLAGEDSKATNIIANLINQLHAVPRSPDANGITPVEELMVHFERFGQYGDDAGFDGVRDAISDGERSFSDLLAKPARPLVLHGDLHHFNILRDEEGGWRAIDPHGYWGPPIFEVGAMMKNPLPVIFDDADMPALMTQRVHLLARVLGHDAAAIHRSSFVYAVISLLWTIEIGGDWRPFVPVVECLACLQT